MQWNPYMKQWQPGPEDWKPNVPQMPMGNQRPMVGQGGYFNDIPHPYVFWRRWMMIFVGGAAIEAGQNCYQQTGDTVLAAKVGAEAAARWALWSWLWLFSSFAAGWSCILWWTGLATGIWSPAWWGYLSAPLLIIGWPLWCGVTWCRNIDYCLFRRGMWYKLFQPLYVRTDNWHPALLSGIAVAGIGLTLMEWFSYLAGAWG